MFKMVKRNEKGFTLIELMIVIAIIGILAAIAVPQFMTYRMRAYNTAAKSTCHNLKADNANLNSELGVYGHTEAAAALLSAGTGDQDEADATVDPDLARPASTSEAGARIAGATTTDPVRQLAVGVALGSNMIAYVTDDNTASNLSTYNAYARHFKGDTAYGINGEVENAMYSVTNAAWANTAGLGATAIDALIDDDGVIGGSIDGEAGDGDPTVAWTLVP